MRLTPSKQPLLVGDQASVDTACHSTPCKLLTWWTLYSLVMVAVSAIIHGTTVRLRFTRVLISET